MEQQNRTPLQRATELVDKMTLEEMAAQLRYDAPAIERLGVPAYNWWNEALHGLARAGTATMFPQAIGLAAMFDTKTIYEVADITSTETRAKYNMSIAKGDRDIYKGLTVWSPNINIFRDPRWGRGHETYGEDPYLTAELGIAFVKGLQQEEQNEYMKVAACAKHFAVHSGPEESRHEFDAIVSEKNLRETYLPAFKKLIQEAGVEAVMGAYNRVNGEPSCGSQTLLLDILREEWGFTGHVVSDCGAICDFHQYHHVTETAAESAAMALKNGCDLNCGQSYQSLITAHDLGLINDEDVRTAAIRLFTTRFKLGMFDKDCIYNQIPYTVIEQLAHIEKSLEAAQKSMVLLKNNGILPLDRDKTKTIAVIGPNANSREILKGNYCGTSSHYTTILEGIQDAADSSSRILYSEGCHLYNDRVEVLSGYPNDRTAEAVSVAELSDVVILCLGLDATLEGEQGDSNNSYASGDKPDLQLPQSQRDLLQAVLAVKKPTILLLSSGSAIDLTLADQECAAILQTWYCGALGGKAAAQILFGEVNPSGKLPVTFYRSLDTLPAFDDYAMKGRTYRYIDESPLYPFGFGLSYSSVKYKNLQSDTTDGKINDGDSLVLSVKITNESDLPCDETTQVYVAVDGSSQAIPHHSLCGFTRTSLAPRETRTVSIPIAADCLTIVNDAGQAIYDGTGYRIYIGGSQPDEVSRKLTGESPLLLALTRA